MTRRAAATAAVPGTLAAVQQVRAQAPACRFDLDKTASPAVIELGETVEVTLKVGGTCPAVERTAEVMLIMDTSTSMGWEGKIEAAKRAAVGFVRQMDPARVRVGLITFFRVPVLEQPLTTDQAALIRIIEGLTLERGTNLVDALDLGRQTLASAGVRPGAGKVIVFLTDGRHMVSSPPISQLDRVIAGVRAANIEVYTVGLGSDVDDNVLRRMASSPTHYYFSPGSAQLEEILGRIAGQVRAQVLIASGRVTDEVPANMVYERGSGRPFEPSVTADGRTLAWDLANVREPGLELRYRLRPTEAGVWPTNVRADLRYTDGLGATGELPFPVPEVEVREPPPDTGLCVCKIVRRRVPLAVIEAILAHPERTYGWKVPLDPGKPPSPANPPRECLTLRNIAIDYHPLFNPPIWHVGCP
jgi:Mg-chelatase subunit ChlD